MQPMQTSTNRPAVFDFRMLRRNRDRAAAGFREGPDFLHKAVAESLVERLRDVPRRFSSAVVLGDGAGRVRAALAGVETAAWDPAPRMAALTGAGVMEGEDLPLDEGSADLAVSVLLLHHLNDPVGHLIQLRRALKPDGLMLAALLAGRTLYELRAALAEAETEVLGGLGPRVAPMAEIRDLGGLLQRAGLAMPVADGERRTASYESPLHLMRDLRAMGESNTLAARPRRILSRDVLARTAEIYRAHFPAGDGRVRATFEIVWLTGWSPGPGQPQPLRPGGATARLADALGTVERSAGEKAGDGS